jgi:DNA helicase IV
LIEAGVGIEKGMGLPKRLISIAKRPDMPDFRFRLPAINELTRTQRIALAEVNPLLVTGGPGSGKTVVSMFRFLRQIALNQNSIFFTYNRTLMSAIRGTLRQRARILLPDLSEAEVEEVVENNIASIHEWYGDQFHDQLTTGDRDAIRQNFTSYVADRREVKYAELFIDESQDLRPVIIENAYRLAEMVSCSADRSQDLHGHYPEPADDMIHEILNASRTTRRQELSANFRNTREIFAFARCFVPEDVNVQNINIDELPVGEEVDVRRNLSDTAQLSLIVEIMEQNANSNIGIIVHSSKEIITIKEYLETGGYSCDANAPEAQSFSYYYSGMQPRDKAAMEHRLQTPFIITFESCKGLEFDIVILAFFNSSEWALTKFKKSGGVVERDANGAPKTWTTPNHYYVAATRARRQLYVLHDRKPPILSFYDENFRGNVISKDDLPF